jgi:XTP/dITP diphosphohydrolase
LPTAQPALSLAQKVIERVTSAGLPWDLLPSTITTVALKPGRDAESDLRAHVLEFMDVVRRVEGLIGASRSADNLAELDVSPLGVIGEGEWRTYWLNSS